MSEPDREFSLYKQSSANGWKGIQIGILFAVLQNNILKYTFQAGEGMALLNALYYLIKRSFFKVSFPLGISVDITNRCNLQCKHCYFLKQNQKGELGDEELLLRIQELKINYPSVMHAGWLGGEPLLRKELLVQCAQLFPLNMIVTNGTIELPVINNSVYNVSVDGTREYYESIRGTGVYDKVKDNADRNDIRINVACVLNRLNGDCVESFLKEWKNTHIQGISFSFYTPQRGVDDSLYLNDVQKDKIIDRILILKKEYGNFILNSRSILKLMKSTTSSEITTRCMSPRALLSIDAKGKIKNPCVMGSDADCSRCGCVVPFEIESVVKRRHFDSMRMVKKFYTGH
ncbi:MAG TPA: radical SAM protein [Chitinispirillaceae bacterium]|nr:radical SAM protein [Chitinispirillaceae bacterium]